MQVWRRWREPLAVALLIALGLMLVVRGTALALVLEAGLTGGMVGGLPGGDDLLLLATAGAVLWCATPMAGADPADDAPVLSPHAWPIALVGLVIVGLTVLGWLVLAIWNAVTVATRPAVDLGFVLLVAEGLLRLAVPVAALVAVVLSVRRAGAVRTADRERPPAISAVASEDVDGRAASPEAERLPAAWHPAEATGAVWLTADDAAQGRPGMSWADPAAPAPGQDLDPAAKPRSAAEDDDLR